MADVPHPPKSPTLMAPRKSVELEDPGAHELEASENEDDEFADAPEGRGSQSGPSSPVPTTRVEKVDDRQNHGEIPGTAAYKMRTQDAVPDELEIIPEGGESRPGPRNSQEVRPGSPAGTQIPKTVVEKVDSASSSRDDVPGTAAHSRRKADAVPDVVLQASDDESSPHSKTQTNNVSSKIPVPKTVITKVDSKPSHGEVPGTDAFDMRKGDAKPDMVEKKGDVPGLPTNSLSRSDLSKPRRSRAPIEGNSPIAADGGFGPMDSEGFEDENVNSEPDEADSDRKSEDDKQFGDDFDDFEAGGEEEDFGDFDDGFQEPSTSGEDPDEEEQLRPSFQSIPTSTSPFPILDFSELSTLDDYVTGTNLYLDQIFPTTKEPYPRPPPLPSEQSSVFLTDRSLSLWSQLVAPPPLQPPNWVRSRTRRLFLVSLGVPVDLDEILPASKQKKLVLPSIHLRSGSQSPPEGRRPSSRNRLKHDNPSSTSIDQPSSNKTGRRRKGPSLAPEIDLQATRMLCSTTDAALANMTDRELQAHVNKLEEMTAKASEVLEYWLKRRDSALGDKEAFEGVIENLVKHARRVRK